MKNQLIGILGKALVPIAVVATFALARKYISATSMKAPEPRYSQEVLDSRFGFTKWVVGVSMVAVGSIFAWSTHAAFVWLNEYFSAADGPADFRLWPQTPIWWFFPGFGALTLSWEITLQLWLAFGNRNEADLYSYWSSQSAGFDTRKMLRWIALLIALPIGVSTALELHTHTVLRQDDIRDCGFAFSQCNTYPYSAARRMTIIEGFRDRDGNLISRAGIVIDFSDGRRWSSADDGDFRESVDHTFAEFIQMKTHLQVNYAQTQADIPLIDYKP